MPEVQVAVGACQVIQARDARELDSDPVGAHGREAADGRRVLANSDGCCARIPENADGDHAGTAHTAHTERVPGGSVLAEAPSARPLPDRGLGLGGSMQQKSRGREHMVVGLPEGQVRQGALDQSGVELPGAHGGFVQQQAKIFQIGMYAEYERVGEGAVETGEGEVSVGAPGDDLGQHRVVRAADRQARQQCAVDADAVADGLAQGQHRAGHRQKVSIGIFGVDPRLDCMPAQAYILLVEGERLPRSDAQLPVDQVDAGDQFGDRVLDLKAGVHLHEKKLVGGVGGDQEFDGASSAIVDAAGGGARGLADASPRRFVEQRRRRLLDDLLVATLQ